MLASEGPFADSLVQFWLSHVKRETEKGEVVPWPICVHGSLLLRVGRGVKSASYTFLSLQKLVSKALI